MTILILIGPRLSNRINPHVELPPEKNWWFQRRDASGLRVSTDEEEFFFWRYVFKWRYSPREDCFTLFFFELSQVLSVGNENSFIKSDPSTYVLFTNPFLYLLCPFLYLPFVCLQPYWASLIRYSDHSQCKFMRICSEMTVFAEVKIF